MPAPITTSNETIEPVPMVQRVGMAPAFQPTGLLGATAAARLVGGTASGAPVSGNFQIGDAVLDQTGKVWLCTVAGSPGTWVQVGGGGGGGGSQITRYPIATVLADFGPVSTGSDGTFADVPGLTKTFTTTATSTIRAWTKGCFTLTGSNVYMRILLGAAPFTFDGTNPSISRFSGAVTDDPGLLVEKAGVVAGTYTVKAQYATAGQIYCRPVSGFETMALAVESWV